MKKNLNYYDKIPIGVFSKKIIRIMKLSLFLSLLTIFQLWATDTYSQLTMLSLKLENVKISDALKEIENQSEFFFLYSPKLIDVERRVSIDSEKEPIKDILTDIFGEKVKFAVYDKQIILAPKEESELFSVIQQQKEVTGKITDSGGNPLTGVTVLLKGTTTGTLTDINGKYTIPVPGNQSILSYSFIGFITQEVTVGALSTVNVTLAEALTQINEVIVTALGIKRETKSLGYAATSVDSRQVIGTNTVNVGNTLTGKVAGLNVSTPPSGAGGSSKLRIRGQSSFGGDNSPLIVVNGIPIDNSSTVSTGVSGGDLGDGLQSINPEDIESITVLKGASAAALYGFRAKDGVLIITTKTGTGKKGLGIEVTSSYTASQPLDFLNDYQYVYGQGEFGKRPTSVSEARSSGGWSFGTKFDGEDVWSIDGNQHPYVPFKDRISTMFNTGQNFTNSVAFSAGDSKGNSRFSIANVDAANIIPNSSYNKKIMDLGVNYKFGELSVQLNANYSIEDNKNPEQSAVQSTYMATILNMANSIDPRWTKDSYKDPVTGNEVPWNRLSDHTGWYWITNERASERKRNRIYGNLMLHYQLAPWLYLQGRIGQDYYTSDSWSKTPTGALNLATAVTGFNGSFSQGTNSFRELNSDFLIGANKKFGVFGIDATLGGNTMDQVSQNLSTSVTNFYLRDLYTISNGQTKNPSYSYSEKKVNSLYGTLNLSFKDYLYLNVTGRNDWFSTLNPKSNHYLYPSVSGSFLFKQAFASIMPSWLTYGKLRASYAEVGGDTNPYTNTLFYSIQTNQFGTFPYGGISGSTSPNPDLRPLKVKETEVGMELIFFDRRLSVDVAAYRKNTMDEILNVDISSQSGYSSTKVNVGRLRNQGIETLLTLVPIHTQNFTWESGINYTYNISKVLALANNQVKIDVASSLFVGTISEEVGKPMGSVRGYDYLRDDQGRVILNNGIFSAGSIKTFGSGIPPHIGGWLNTLTYKGIRVFAQIDFKAGRDFVLISNTAYNALRKGLSKESLVGRNDGETGVIFDGVNPDGSPNTTAVECETFYTNYSGKKVGTPFVYNASFVRWRTLSVGYDFSRFVSKTIIKGLTLNANVNNLLVIYSKIPNLDPECVSTVSDTSVGLEAVTAPSTRDYTISINVKF